MNSLMNQPSSLISASSSPTPNYIIGMHYSFNRIYPECFNGKDDHITPLVDKLYCDERNERSSGNLNTLEVNHLNNIHRQEFGDDTRRWSVGKISFLILIVLSLADVIIHMVDAQLESLEAYVHYDALSADVIRPAFRYRGEQSRSGKTKTRPSMGLGSAAISSVTTTLSPILPFTGGIDLRREDYWTNGLFGSISSVVEKVLDAFEESPTNFFSSSDLDEDDSMIGDVLAMPRGGAAVAARTRSSHKSKTKNKSHSTTKQHESILSGSDCFVPLKDIAESTLKDVAMSFRYTLESTRSDFNSGKFLSGLLPRVNKMMERMSTATTLARGNGVLPPITAEQHGRSSAAVPTGDIDAINFCATMRIFAEWRVLRQVPPGYKGYAVGIGLGQKDIVQNIAKIEHAIHDYINLRSKNGDDENTSSFPSNGTNSRSQHVVTSPTLRDLLQYEVDTDVQDVTKLPRLKEKSAAMGLLWVRRQLVYQTAIFNNVLDVPSRFDSSRAAVQAAYDEVYGDLHGWAVQKIFSYSFQAAPDGIEIFKYMNPHRLEEVKQEARAKILGFPVEKKRKSRGPFNLGSKFDNSPIGKFSKHIGNEWNKVACNVVYEWDKFSDNVGSEWDKMASNIGQLFGPQHRQQEHQANPKQPENNCAALATTELQPGMASDEAAKELEMESYISQEMRDDAYDHIKAYLEVVDPLLEDISALIDEFNMNDPTKV
jgi:hypothetical protein